MTRLSWTLLVLWVSLGAQSTHPVKFTPDPIKLGSVVPGATSAFHITLQNSGPGPLRVDQVQADCGCLNLKLDSLLLVPGGSAVLHGLLQAPLQEGTIQKHIRIRFERQDPPDLVLPVQATCKALVRAEPGELRLADLSPGSPRRVLVKLRADIPMSPGLFPTTWPPGLEAYFLEEDDPHEIDLTVVIDPSRMLGRAGSHTLEVSTGIPAHPRIQIPLRWRLVDRYSVAPEVPVLKRKGDPVMVTLREVQGRPFRIAKVNAPSAYVEVVILDAQVPGIIEVRLTPKGGPLAESMPIHIELRTDQEGDPPLWIRAVIDP